MFFWHFVTRLGEAQILLPAAMLAALSFAVRHRSWRTAGLWLVLLASATLLTLASKLAFIGWGLGWAELDFTGVSGHAMLAAALYPLLLAALIPARTPTGRRCVVGLGIGLALLVGVSRVVVGAHSWSEVLAGLALGAMVTAVVMVGRPAARERPGQSRAGFPMGSLLMPLVIAAWVTVTFASAPLFSSHAVVTRLSLTLAGHTTAHTRAGMLRAMERRNSSVDSGA
jgi:hypothetical protein